MKKAVITILGIQNPKFNDDGVACARDFNHQARYYFSDDSRIPKEYYNTLPLLIERYASSHDIVPIYTKEAKDFNQDILKLSKKSCIFDDALSLIDDSTYFEIFQKIDSLMDMYDEVVVDLTHGFRHIPILVIIDLVIQNFSSTKKVDKILFAKEIVKHTPIDTGEYEIVDLKEYMDIANISFVLSSFEDNYTISNHIKTKDRDFQVLIDMFSEFSKNIMANSLIYLFKDENSLVDKMYEAIESIKFSPKAKPILYRLENIQKHLKTFTDLRDKKTYIQLFELAKIVNKKGYYLNAITLLNEAVGWYCADSLCAYSKSFEHGYKKIKESRDTYKIVKNAKNIVRFTFENREYNNELNIKDVKDIQAQLEQIEGLKAFSINLIKDVDINRNNLAHANSGKKLNDIKKILEKLFGRYQTYCIDKDVLKKQDGSIGDLMKKFNN